MLPPLCWWMSRVVNFMINIKMNNSCYTSTVSSYLVSFDKNWCTTEAYSVIFKCQIFDQFLKCWYILHEISNIYKWKGNLNLHVIHAVGSVGSPWRQIQEYLIMSCLLIELVLRVCIICWQYLTYDVCKISFKVWRLNAFISYSILCLLINFWMIAPISDL